MHIGYLLRVELAYIKLSQSGAGTEHVVHIGYFPGIEVFYARDLRQCF